MCFFSPDGDLDIQERRPRYPGEPRRKRLAFVREHGSGKSDDDWDTRTYRSSNRSPHRSSMQEIGEHQGFSQPPHGCFPIAGQHPQHGQQPIFGQQPAHGQLPMPGQHPLLGQQAPHGQFHMAGQHPQYGPQPMFCQQPAHGQPLMIEVQPQYPPPFRPQQPPGAAMMAQPVPNRPLPPGGFQQPLRVERGNANDIVEIVEPRRGQGHFERRDQRHIQDGPRARMPHNLRRDHPRGRSRHQDHRRRDEMVYSSDDDDDSFGSDRGLSKGSWGGWSSDSDDSFAAPVRSPRRRDSRYRR